MEKPRVVRVRESILQQNRIQAEALRAMLTDKGIRLVNVMASPGAGKTSLILRTISALRTRFRIAVIEADMDSTVDADKMSAVAIPAVQIETGGFCHVEPAMTRAAVNQLPLPDLDLVFLENVGNLICTAQNDPGAHINVAVLSVPEGDDKPLKYPVMFTVADAVVVNKTDFLDLTDFDLRQARERIRVLNGAAPVMPVSCRTGDGITGWVAWLEDAIRSGGRTPSG